MNQAGNNITSTKQNVASANQQSVTGEAKAKSRTDVKNTTPADISSSETTLKSQKQQKVSHPSNVEFIPSPQDSIEFNLKTRAQDKEGILNNTVVRDFLEPTPRSDKKWVRSSAKTQAVTFKYQTDTKEKNTQNDIEAIKHDSTSYNTTNDSSTVACDSASLKVKQDAVILKPISKQPDGIGNYSKDILTALIILSVAIVGITRITNYKYLRELFSSLIFSQHARKMLKEENLRNQKAAFTLNGLFLFNTSLFVYEYIHHKQISTSLTTPLLLIPISMGIILAFGLIKNMLYRFSGFVFECTPQITEYIFFTKLHDKIFGLIILPIVLVVPYIEKTSLPLLFNLGIGVYVLLYLMQLFRGLTIILKNVASLFYMFLYLCALEILPLIIMYHILIK